MKRSVLKLAKSSLHYTSMHQFHKTLHNMTTRPRPYMYETGTDGVTGTCSFFLRKNQSLIIVSSWTKTLQKVNGKASLLTCTSLSPFSTLICSLACSLSGENRKKDRFLLSGGFFVVVVFSTFCPRTSVCYGFESVLKWHNFLPENIEIKVLWICSNTLTLNQVHRVFNNEHIIWVYFSFIRF